MSNKSVLITGCSTGGIGHALAVAYQKRGLTVFATARTPSKTGDLGSLPNVHIIALDVTSASSIAAAAKEVDSKTGGKLDILVNNAGAQYHMPTLDLDLDKARQLFEVNVWGVVSVTQAFSDMVIKAKGVIANVGSIAGSLPIPMQTVYNASKAAVNNISETLRLELAPLGVRVLTVMLGGVTSQIENNAERVVLPSTSHYRPIEKDLQPRDNWRGMSTDKFAGWLVTKTLGGSNGMIWNGDISGIVRWAVPIMPQWMLDRIMIANGGGIGKMTALQT